MTARADGRQDEPSYHDLLGLLPEPHWVLGEGHAVVSANAAAAELVGRSPGELTGIALGELVTDEAAKVDRYLTMCARSAQMVPGALSFRGADGGIACRCDGAVLRAATTSRPALILLRCRPRTATTSRFVALTERVDALNREVALRLEAERVLRRQAELLEQTHDAVLVWGLDGGELAYLNRAAEELYGWPRREALGQSVGALFQTETTAAETAMRRQIRDAGEWSGERIHTSRQGRRIIVESRMVRMLGDDGVGLVLETTRDVTDQRRLRSHLEATQRMEAVGRLAGGAAHEINNALQGAVGFANFALRRMAPDDAVRDDVLQVLRSSERAAAITLGLLAFSRRQVLQPTDLDLSRAMAEFEPVCRQAFGADRDLRVEPPQGPIVIYADRGQLEQVVLNLVLNARDATEPGGWLKIRVATAVVPGAELVRLGRPELTSGTYGCLEVEDSGHGMDQATMARIYEPFYTTKPPGKGTGLGLAVVHGIVHQSGGAIAVRSAPGHGTTFTIYLPLAAGFAAPPPPEEHPAVRGGAERVMVVDDEPLVLQVATRLLEEEGYAVITAADGATALQRLQELARDRAPGVAPPVDVVLTDIIMPVLGGRELGAELERRYPGLPVLYTSGHAGEEMTRRGLLADTATFIQKPFSPEQLLLRIRSVLDHSRAS